MVEVEFSGRQRKALLVIVLMFLLFFGLYRCESSASPGVISDRAFSAVKIGVTEASIRSVFGVPLSSDSIPHVLPAPAGDECMYYEDDGPAIDGTTYRFCFKGGVLVLKDGYGPLFESGQVAASPPESV